MDKVTFASTQTKCVSGKRENFKEDAHIYKESQNQIKYRRLLAASWSSTTNQSFPYEKNKIQLAC